MHTHELQTVKWQEHQIRQCHNSVEPSQQHINCTQGSAQGLGALASWIGIEKHIAGGSTESHLNVLAKVLAASCVGANVAIYASLEQELRSDTGIIATGCALCISRYLLIQPPADRSAYASE